MSKRQLDKATRSDLMTRLLEKSFVTEASPFRESKVLNGGFMVPTNIPLMNIALSGSIHGGLQAGVNMIAGPTKHFKTLFALIEVAAYMRKYDDAIMLFYDSEFGAPAAYLEGLGIDLDRVVHIPVPTIEDLKFDLIQKLMEIKRGDHVVVLLDSMGNIASNKEVNDAVEQKSKADMTRAKALKSMFRIATTYFIMKDIPFIVVNHTYKSMDHFPVDVVTGGEGGKYAANSIWIVGKSQNKDGKDLQGYDFKIKVDKSRSVIEKSVFPITVSFDGGVDQFSGLFDLALELGWVKEAKKGYYNRCTIDLTTGEVTQLDDKSWRRSEASEPEFWKGILDNPSFDEMIKAKYSLAAQGDLIQSNETSDFLTSLIEKSAVKE